MDKHRSHAARPARALVMLLALFAASGALAAGKVSPVDPKAGYQRESAACAGIRNPDLRASCQEQAGGRFARSQPTPPEEQADALRRNALKRCEPLPEPQRKDCVSRIQGQGSTSGSVAGGGIYRELVTREVGVPEPVQPQSAKPPAPQAAGAAIDDTTITTQIRSRLYENKEVAGSNIGVETLDGIVILTGSTRSSAEKSSADAIARGVDGVKSIRNQIVVQP